MEIQEFELAIKARVDTFVEELLTRKEWMAELYNEKKSDPTLIPWTHMDIDSRIRFNMKMQPHTLVGDEFFDTDKYEDAMERLHHYAVHWLGKEIYKELW